MPGEGEEERGEGEGGSFPIPELPSGSELVLNILSTWGDRYYLGLSGVEVFTVQGERARVEEVGVAFSADINLQPLFILRRWLERDRSKFSGVPSRSRQTQPTLTSSPGTLETRGWWGTWWTGSTGPGTTLTCGWLPSLLDATTSSGCSSQRRSPSPWSGYG